jgi:hypothetical protein
MSMDLGKRGGRLGSYSDQFWAILGLVGLLWGSVWASIGALGGVVASFWTHGQHEGQQKQPNVKMCKHKTYKHGCGGLKWPPQPCCPFFNSCKLLKFRTYEVFLPGFLLPVSNTPPEYIWEYSRTVGELPHMWECSHNGGVLPH